MTTTMTTLLVHESHWGNTRAVAEAIAEGMVGTDQRSVEIVDVGAAPSPLPAGVDLLVVGGPPPARVRGARCRWGRQLAAGRG